MDENCLFPCSVPEIVMHRGMPLFIQHREARIPAFRCQQCGYIFFEPPHPNVLADYYNNEYPANAANWYTYENDHDPHRCGYRVDYLRNLAKRFIGTDSVIYHESGCAFGGTVRRFNELGLDATGTELNRAAVEAGRSKGNLKITDESDAAFLGRTNRSVDVFYTYHSLEHMPAPVEFLREIRRHCSGRSIVVVHVPNSVSIHSLVQGFQANSWFAYPDHLHLISPGSAICIAERAGYSILDVSTAELTAGNDDEVLLGLRATSEEAAILSESVHSLLLGQELLLVLTPSDSDSASLHADTIRETRGRCLDARVREQWLLNLIAAP